MLNITPAHVDVSATIAMLLARCQERQRQRTRCAVQHQLDRNRTAAAEHPHLVNLPPPPAWHAHPPTDADRPAPPETVPSQLPAELATAPPSPSLLPVDAPVPADALPAAAQPAAQANEMADYQEFLQVLTALRAERELSEADASSLAAQGCEILARVSSMP